MKFGTASRIESRGVRALIVRLTILPLRKDKPRTEARSREFVTQTGKDHGISVGSSREFCSRSASGFRDARCSWLMLTTLAHRSPIPPFPASGRGHRLPQRNAVLVQIKKEQVQVTAVRRAPSARRGRARRSRAEDRRTASHRCCHRREASARSDQTVLLRKLHHMTDLELAMPPGVFWHFNVPSSATSSQSSQ
jgi:hypothetical protein